MKTAEQKSADAINLIEHYGMIDGAHHKQWLLDRVVNALLGGEEDKDSEEYKAWVSKMNRDPDYEEWDRGIAP